MFSNKYDLNMEATCLLYVVDSSIVDGVISLISRQFKRYIFIFLNYISKHAICTDRNDEIL